jgi:hypothetical protein
MGRRFPKSTGPVIAAVSAWRGASDAVRFGTAAAVAGGLAVAGLAAWSTDAAAGTYGFLDLEVAAIAEPADIPESISVDPDSRYLSGPSRRPTHFAMKR